MSYAGAGLRFVIPNQFSVDASGVPRAGAQMFFYATGTNTYQNTYSDSGLTVPNVNPVIADANGQFGNVFLLTSPAYHVVLEDANGVVIWDMDPVGPEITQTGAMPVGGEIDFAGATAPAGWLLEYGQAISRTTYSALFAVIGTTYGNGDGSTTFNLPDARGRVYAGVDNMGGTAANRITAAVSGVNGIVLGASGGSQNAQQDTITNSTTITSPTYTISSNAVKQNTPTPGSGVGGIGVGYTWFPATESIIQSGTFGVTVNSVSGLTGTSQNVQPTSMRNRIIYTGVGG